MKIWLDDERRAPDGYIWCKSVSQAKTLLIAFLYLKSGMRLSFATTLDIFNKMSQKRIQ